MPRILPPLLDMPSMTPPLEQIFRPLSVLSKGWFGLDDWARDSLALFTPLLFSGIGPCLE